MDHRRCANLWGAPIFGRHQSWTTVDALVDDEPVGISPASSREAIHLAYDDAPTDATYIFLESGHHPRPDRHFAPPCSFPHCIRVSSVIGCKFFPCIPTAVGGQPASSTVDVTIHRRSKCFRPVGWCSPPAAGTVEVTIHRRLRCGGGGGTCHHTAAGAGRQWRWRAG